MLIRKAQLILAILVLLGQVVAFSAPAFAADQTDQQLPTTQGQQPSTDGGADKLNDQNSTPKDQGSNVPDDQGPAD